MGVARAVAGGDALGRGTVVARAPAVFSGSVLGRGSVVAGAPGVFSGGVLARADAGVRVDAIAAALDFRSVVTAVEVAAPTEGLLAGAFAFVVAALGLEVSRSSDADIGGEPLSRLSAVGACCTSVSGSNAISSGGGFERSGAIGLAILRKPGRIAGGGCVGGGTEGRCDIAGIDG